MLGFTPISNPSSTSSSPLLTPFSPIHDYRSSSLNPCSPVFSLVKSPEFTGYKEPMNEEQRTRLQHLLDRNILIPSQLEGNPPIQINLRKLLEHLLNNGYRPLIIGGAAQSVFQEKDLNDIDIAIFYDTPPAVDTFSNLLRSLFFELLPGVDLDELITNFFRFNERHHSIESPGLDFKLISAHGRTHLFDHDALCVEPQIDSHGEIRGQFMAVPGAKTGTDEAGFRNILDAVLRKKLRITQGEDSHKALFRVANYLTKGFWANKEVYQTLAQQLIKELYTEDRFTRALTLFLLGHVQKADHELFMTNLFWVFRNIELESKISVRPFLGLITRSYGDVDLRASVAALKGVLDGEEGYSWHRSGIRTPSGICLNIDIDLETMENIVRTTPNLDTLLEKLRERNYSSLFPLLESLKRSGKISINESIEYCKKELVGKTPKEKKEIFQDVLIKLRKGEEVSSPSIEWAILVLLDPLVRDGIDIEALNLLPFFKEIGLGADWLDNIALAIANKFNGEALLRAFTGEFAHYMENEAVETCAIKKLWPYLLKNEACLARINTNFLVRMLFHENKYQEINLKKCRQFVTPILQNLENQQLIEIFLYIQTRQKGFTKKNAPFVQEMVRRVIQNVENIGCMAPIIEWLLDLKRFPSCITKDLKQLFAFSLENLQVAQEEWISPLFLKVAAEESMTLTSEEVERYTPIFSRPLSPVYREKISSSTKEQFFQKIYSLRESIRAALPLENIFSCSCLEEGQVIENFRKNIQKTVPSQGLSSTFEDLLEFAYASRKVSNRDAEECFRELSEIIFSAIAQSEGCSFEELAFPFMDKYRVLHEEMKRISFTGKTGQNITAQNIIAACCSESVDPGVIYENLINLASQMKCISNRLAWNCFQQAALRLQNHSVDSWLSFFRELDRANLDIKEPDDLNTFRSIVINMTTKCLSRELTSGDLSRVFEVSKILFNKYKINLKNESCLIQCLGFSEETSPSEIYRFCCNLYEMYFKQESKDISPIELFVTLTLCLDRVIHKGGSMTDASYSIPDLICILTASYQKIEDVDTIYYGDRLVRGLEQGLQFLKSQQPYLAPAQEGLAVDSEENLFIGGIVSCFQVFCDLVPSTDVDSIRFKISLLEMIFFVGKNQMDIVEGFENIFDIMSTILKAIDSVESYDERLGLLNEMQEIYTTNLSELKIEKSNIKEAMMKNAKLLFSCFLRIFKDACDASIKEQARTGCANFKEIIRKFG
ncbi:MAG: hypothetical protein ACOYK9_05050 [Chlamydiia bacterium]